MGQVQLQDDVPVGQRRGDRARGVDFDAVPLPIVEGQREQPRIRARGQAPRTTIESSPPESRTTAGLGAVAIAAI